MDSMRKGLLFLIIVSIVIVLIFFGNIFITDKIISIKPVSNFLSDSSVSISSGQITSMGPLTCTDSDGGVNPEEPGKVTVKKRYFLFGEKTKKYTDGCWSESDLYEYSCQNGKERIESIFCNNGCENNACKTSNKDCETNQNCGGSIAIVVDDLTYGRLHYEIERFIEDIRVDTPLSVELKTIPQNSDAKLVKDFLKDLYFTKNLKAAIFVGDVPYTEYSTQLYGDVSPELFFPTDYYYYDVYDLCPEKQNNKKDTSLDKEDNSPTTSTALSSEKKIYDSANRFCNPFVFPFIISRIISQEDETRRLVLLKNYFDQNHAYRAGAFSFDNGALIYPSILNDVEGQRNRAATLNNLIENFKKLYNIKDLPIYESHEIIVADWEQSSIDVPSKPFLREISKNYEYVYVNAHGDSYAHDYEIDNSTLKNPSAFFIDINSCNVGKFDSPHYLAGHYLFSGKSMFIKAYSENVFSPIGAIDSGTVYLLKQGLPLYEALQYEEPFPSMQYFGDITLRLPKGEAQKRSRAEAMIFPSEINFGTLPVCNSLGSWYCEDKAMIKEFSVSVSNKGLESLGIHTSFLTDFSLETINNSHPVEGSFAPYVLLTDYENYKLPTIESSTSTSSTGTSLGEKSSKFEVPPQMKSTLKMAIYGFRPGHYTGNILLYTNDPKNPVIKIPYEVTFI